jgi:hypothetical protein
VKTGASPLGRNGIWSRAAAALRDQKPRQPVYFDGTNPISGESRKAPEPDPSWTNPTRGNEANLSLAFSTQRCAFSQNQVHSEADRVQRAPRLADDSFKNEANFR